MENEVRARKEKVKPVAVSRMRGMSEEAEAKRDEVAVKISEKSKKSMKATSSMVRQLEKKR